LKSELEFNFTEADDKYGLLGVLPQEAECIYRIVHVQKKDGSNYFTACTGTQCDESPYVYIFSVKMSAERNRECCDDAEHEHEHQLEHQSEFDIATAMNHVYVLDVDLNAYMNLSGKSTLNPFELNFKLLH
jgi:hypothetical protein